MRRRLQARRNQPGWFTVRAGPAAGARLFLPNDWDGAWREMVAGTFDAFLYNALREQRGLKGSVCWDIGAHVGYHSLSLASQGAQVLAFEPNRANLERLLLHIKGNPSIGLRVRELAAAVSDRDGETSFLQCSDLNGGSSGSHLAEATPPLDEKVYGAFERIIVPTVRIDTLIARGERPPDVIKMDVEGGEFAALEGGRKTLAQTKPILLVEVHHICLMQRIQRLLQELGYVVRILDEEHASPSRCFVMAYGRQ